MAHEQVWCEFSYGKEDTIHSLSDAKKHFSNFIISRRFPYRQLLEKLNKIKAEDPCRFGEQNAKGEVIFKFGVEQMENLVQM